VRMIRRCFKRQPLAILTYFFVAVERFLDHPSLDGALRLRARRLRPGTSCVSLLGGGRGFACYEHRRKPNGRAEVLRAW